MRPRIAIVGAGIGGLAAAARLAPHCEVDVFERTPAAGGKIRTVPAGDYAIDAGPTVFTMRWVFEELFSLAGARFSDRVRAAPLDVLARHAWGDGSTLDLYADTQHTAQAIASFANAAEAGAYLSWCAQAKRVYETLKNSFIRAEAPSLFGLMSRQSPVALMGIQPFSTLWSALEQRFADPRLRQLFGRYATYCGSSPFEVPATLMLISHVEQEGVYALDGGMRALADAICNLAQAAGARFHFDMHVAEINVENRGATGLRFANGAAIEADAVIFNGDVAALAASHFGNGARRAVGDKPRERSLSALTFAFSAKAEGFVPSMHNVFFGGNYRAEFEQVFARGVPPADPTVYLFAPARAAAAPSADEPFFCLINAPPNGDSHVYDKDEIEQWSLAALETMERRGLTLTLTSEISATTPADFAKMFPATGGALYGQPSHGWQASFQRPGVRSRIPGLYLAGGSVHPGPGAPMAALSGMAAAQAILADYRLM